MDLDIVTLSVGDNDLDFYVRKGSSDTSLIGQIFVDKAFDLSDLKRYSEILDLNETISKLGRRALVVDAGANIGLSSLYFSVIVQDPLIVSIEPEADNFAILSLNVMKYGALPIPCALASEHCRVSISDPGDGSWGFRTENAPEAGMSNSLVDTITVNDIISSHEDCVPFIIKIDIEGAEADLFSKNCEWIDRFPIMIVELHDWLMPGEGTSATFMRAAADRDRETIIKGENLISIARDFSNYIKIC